MSTDSTPAQALSRRVVRKQQRAPANPSSSPANNSSDTSSGDEHPAWSDSDEEDDEPQPTDVDESWLYTFKSGERVWIRTVGGNWHRGHVVGHKTKMGSTREKEGVFYPVVFNGKIRKWFSPLNGDIKPDSRHTRSLLEEAGFLDDGEESESED